jgi:hypothetical protein
MSSLDEKAFLAAVETARTKAEEDEDADRKREKKTKKVTLAPADPPIVTSPPASQKPSTSSSSSSSSSSSNGSNSTSPLTATGARLSEWGKLKDKRIEEARKKIIAEREEKELANASFKPDLSLVRQFINKYAFKGIANYSNLLLLPYPPPLIPLILSSIFRQVVSESREQIMKRQAMQTS